MTRIPKLKKYLDLFLFLSDHAEITSKQIKQFCEREEISIPYQRMNSLLKKWAEDRYIHRIQIPNKKLRLGGPKFLYTLSKKGNEFMEGLESQFSKCENQNLTDYDIEDIIETITSELSVFIQNQELLMAVQKILLRELERIL